MVIDKIALALAIIGALNWGGIGLARMASSGISKPLRQRANASSTATAALPAA